MMSNITKVLKNFCKQAKTQNLKTSDYPKEWGNLKMKVSFGQGSPARIPWIAFLSPDNKVTRGIYPVYLYYKKDNILVLAYGVSETEESENNWPVDIQSKSKKIEDYLNIDVPRYGDSFVFKAYKVLTKNGQILFKNLENDNKLDNQGLDSDLKKLLSIYNEVIEDAPIEPGLFYMEKQLEDFLIENWDKTDLGKKYDLIIEEGVVKSQQYQTDVGKIDILARDKKDNSYVVIELKKDQTSDDTVGQIARYIGWVKEKIAKNKKVKGVIIVGSYDKKLDYALKMLDSSKIEVYIYKVDFTLDKFTEDK